MTTNIDPITIGVELKDEIAEAFRTASAEALDSYAGYARKAIVAALREAGHLEPLPAPRRHRGPRRQGAA